MSDVVAWVLGALVVFVVGYAIGQDEGVLSVARSCEKVGAFYVRDKTFKCEVAR